jgi:CotS family spore coat protein
LSNDYEFNVYHSLNRAGIDCKILTLLPYKPIWLLPFAPDCLILETTNGSLALWIYRGPEAVLASQNLLLKTMELNGLPNFLYPLLLNDDRTYGRLDGRRWFYITGWPELRRIFFSNIDDVISLVNLLLDFRRTLNETGGGWIIPGRKESMNLLNKLPAIIESLNSFTYLAKFRLKPTSFDKLFLRYYPEAVHQVKQAFKLLVESEYQDLLANITSKDLIINRLVRNNLRISLKNKAICLRCHDFRQDLPIIDLGTILVKTGRSLQWNYSWFHQVLSEYQKLFPVSKTEYKVLLAFLTCPWSFYRLAARYYYNRTEWSSGAYIDRLKRILKEESNRIKLLAAIHDEI